MPPPPPTWKLWCGMFDLNTPQCWCGSSKDTPDRHGTSSKCTMDCAGADRIAKCGGFYAMDLYEHEGRPDGVPAGAKHLGCFADDPRDRALTLKNQSTSKMDYAVRRGVFRGDLFGRQNCFTW